MNKGAAAEQQAEHYLLRQGLTLLARNFRCKGGEIDLIMDHQGATVFVEVRLRSNQNFASGLESVNYVKQQKILLAAQHFLVSHSARQQTPCRFDVVALNDLNSEPQWLVSAFTA